MTLKTMLAAVFALLTLAWLLAFLLLWRIPCPTGGIPAAAPAISVVVPARNEEKTLPRLLESLRRQDLPVAEIIVVDDHSEDATARLAVRHGARVIRAASLPEGWLGKPWACWQGAGKARGELLVFLDADTWVEPGGLRKIVASHLRLGGLLSVWPYHRMRRPYERLSALFNIVIMASMGSFTLLADRVRSLGAFGPCLVCSRSDYYAAGGHRGVRGAILEDVALGQLFRRAGVPIHNLGGKGSLSFRMYPAGLISLITGFSKGLASGARAASPGILLSIILWMAAGFIASFWLLFLLIGANLPAALSWMALYLLYVLQIHWILRRMGNYGLVTALLYPFPFVFFAAVFVLSLLHTFLRRQVSWKGRTIDIGR